MIADVIKAFTGQESRRFKIKNTPYWMFVDFGTLVLHITNLEEVKEELEKRYECRIRCEGPRVKIVPNVFYKILETDGALCSISEKHRLILEEWIKKNFVRLLKDILRVSSQNSVQNL